LVSSGENVDERAGENGGEREIEGPGGGNVKFGAAGDRNMEAWGIIASPVSENVCSAVKIGMLGLRNDCSGTVFRRPLAYRDVEWVKLVPGGR
jgi:hypothetical protein